MRARPLVRPSLLALVYIPILGVAVVWSALAGTLGGWLGPASRVLPDLGIGIGFGLAVVAATAALVRFVPSYARLADLMAGILGQMSWPAVVLAAVLSSVAEESLFRGAVQPNAGLWLAAVVFAACHFVPDRRFLPWTVFALAAGIGLGWLFEWRGSLVAPVSAHFTVNVINLRLVSMRGRSACGDDDRGRVGDAGGIVDSDRHGVAADTEGVARDRDAPVAVGVGEAPLVDVRVQAAGDDDQ